MVELNSGFMMLNNACNTAIMLKELESLRFRYAPRNRYVKDVCLTKLVKINI